MSYENSIRYCRTSSGAVYRVFPSTVRNGRKDCCSSSSDHDQANAGNMDSTTNPTLRKGNMGSNQKGLPMTIHECKACGWQGEETEIRKEIIHHETRIDPEEWEWYCPDCNGTDIEEVNFPLCRTCEDEIVHHEGDQCIECYTVACEAHVDASRGH